MKQVLILLMLLVISIQVKAEYPKFVQEGIASWYGPGFHGKRTANGERFNTNEMTAAHKSLPFNTLIKVTNLNNGISTIVRITDRGPFVKGRIIDLSKAAKDAIKMDGLARVRLESLKFIYNNKQFDFLIENTPFTDSLVIYDITSKIFWKISYNGILPQLLDKNLIPIDENIYNLIEKYVRK